MSESLHNKADSSISIASFYIFFYNFSRVKDRPQQKQQQQPQQQDNDSFKTNTRKVV